MRADSRHHVMSRNVKILIPFHYIKNKIPIFCLNFLWIFLHFLCSFNEKKSTAQYLTSMFEHQLVEVNEIANFTQFFITF